MSFAELLARFTSPLNQLSIPYMVTGAVAAIVYGVPRLTLDVDLVVELTPENSARLAAAFPPPDFYAPPLEVIQLEAERPEQGHFTLMHHATGFRADIYLAGKDPLDRWGLNHRRQETVAGEPLWLAPAEYVIVRKLEYYRLGGSTKHLQDIQGMLRIRPDLIDLPTVESFVKDRGLAAEWRSASKE